VDGGWSWKFDPRIFARHRLTLEPWLAWRHRV